MKESRQGIYLELWTEMARVRLRVRHGFGHQKIRVGADFCSTPSAHPSSGSLLQKLTCHTKMEPETCCLPYAPHKAEFSPNIWG